MRLERPANPRRTRATARRAGAALGVLSAAALSACGAGSSAYDGPSTWPEASPTGSFSSGTIAPAATTRTGDAAGSRWTLKRAGRGNPNVDPANWPDVSGVLTDAQLKALVPSTASVTKGACSKLSVGGRPTARDSACTWTMTLSSAPTSVNTMTVRLRGFGADGPLTAAWLRAQDVQMRGSISSDTFFATGSFGAKGSYFLQNAHASVLISDGDNAGWIDLEFSGFYSAFGNNADQTTTGLRTEVFPIVTRDLVARMPRTHAGVAVVGTATATS